MTPKDEGYGSAVREAMKKSMERPAGSVVAYRPARLVPTWWDRNGDFVGLVLMGIVVILGVSDIVLLYGMRHG